MALDVQQRASLREHNSFGLPALAKTLVRVSSEADVRRVVDHPEYGVAPKFILGGGSNVVLTRDVDAVVLKVEILGRRLLSGVVGAAMVVGGVACLRNVVNGVMVLALIVGLAWLLTGMSEIGIGLMTHGRTRLWLTTLGVASLVVGLVFVVWPGGSLTAMVLLTGISALVIGCVEIAFAFIMRREVSAAA